MNPRFTFEVDARDIAAMSLLVSDDQSRPILNGVCFWFQGPELTLVATDGRRIGVLRSGAHNASAPTPQDLVLVLDQFEINGLSEGILNCRAVVEVFDVEAIIRIDRRAWIVPIVDGHFPNFWKCFPDDKIREPFGKVPAISVDSKFLRSYGKVATILSGKNGVQMRARGPLEPIEVFCCDKRFFGVLMPLQMDAIERPRWAETLAVDRPDPFPAKTHKQVDQWAPRKVVGATIQTHSGIYFDLRNPSADQVDVRDIAHALANITRFTGHTRGFYSVAQHSVLVSRLVPEHLAYAALLHDAAEAYCGDVSAPLKTLLPDFKEIERRIFEAIVLRLCILDCDSPEIHKADLVALATERRDLMPPSGHVWGILQGIEPDSDRISALDPAAAELEFISRFSELNPGFAFQKGGGAQ